MMSCRQATELMSSELDREPRLVQRLSLGVHLGMCRGCRNFRRQMAFIRNLCRGYSDVTDQPDSCADTCKE